MQVVSTVIHYILYSDHVKVRVIEVFMDFILNSSLFLVPKVMSVQPVSWGNTRPTESPALPSLHPNSWLWSGSSDKSSTCPSQSEQSSPPPWPWRRPRWRFGSRTAAQKLRGSRRPSLRNSRWPLMPRHQRPLLLPERYIPALRYHFRWAPCLCMDSLILPITTTKDPFCLYPRWDYILLRWDTACTTSHKPGDVKRSINGWRGCVLDILKIKIFLYIIYIYHQHKKCNFQSTSDHISNLFSLSEDRMALPRLPCWTACLQDWPVCGGVFLSGCCLSSSLVYISNNWAGARTGTRHPGTDHSFFVKPCSQSGAVPCVRKWPQCQDTNEDGLEF